MIGFLVGCRDPLIAAVMVLFVVLATAMIVFRMNREFRRSGRSSFHWLAGIVFLIVAVDCGADKLPFRLSSWMASALMTDDVMEERRESDTPAVIDE